MLKYDWSEVLGTELYIQAVTNHSHLIAEPSVQIFTERSLQLTIKTASNNNNWTVYIITISHDAYISVENKALHNYMKDYKF